jgi:MGT family glycosyltransferase
MAKSANKKKPTARAVRRKAGVKAKSAVRSRPRRKPARAKKVIALFPEAAFGPALNSVGIGQALEKLGHKVVFLSDPGFLDVYKGYGFEAHAVNLSEPLPPEQMAKFWVDFINGHIPNFRKSPYDQVDNYVRDCWSMIVETAKWAEKDLPGVLASVQPDVICVDNVILFPAIKRYARGHGKPWIRIISCSENEIEDPAIPPHLSGCASDDRRGHARYRRHFNEVIAPIHADFNEFLRSVGEKKYPLGQFFEASPHMNLLLYPSAVRFRRRHRLPPSRFQYLEGCVRKEAPYAVPAFKANEDEPLLYVSFGSLGAGDTALLQRLIAALGRMPVRALVNVGDYSDQYTDVPPNVIVDRWFPQPSVIPQVDAVIHHGGNNSFTECLYFGKPALILPYVWDGHDNATRVQETGHGFKLDRSEWTEEELRDRIMRMLTDRQMKARLRRTSKTMRSRHGPTKAARVIDAVARRRPARRAA